jgi:DNA ligase 1
MKSLPKLYARNSDGTIQEWSIVVDGHRYATIHGKQNCLMVTSDWTTLTEGKNVGRSNATTIEEQALSEAQSRWEKKVKSGGYWEDIKDIDKTKFVEPMLAHHYKDRPVAKVFANGPVMVDRKYNGMRQVCTRMGQFTRKGEKVVSAPHIWQRVKHLFTEHPDLVLDGELYNHTLRFKLSELIKLVNKKKASSVTDDVLKRSEEIVDYYVYDGYGFTVDGKEITQETKCSDRRLALWNLLFDVKDVVVVDFEWAKDDVEVMKFFQTFLEDGYEGAIVRIDAAYQNKRTNDLLKVKPEDDDEGVILEIIEGTGNWSGAAGTAKMSWNGNVFDATFKGEYELRAEILKNPKPWIGKTATFLHIGYTGKAIPTAPNGLPFSPRIDPNNCFKGDR